MQLIKFNDFGGSNKISNPEMIVSISKVNLDYLHQYNIETIVLKNSLNGFNMTVKIKPFNIIVDNGISDRLARIFKHHALVKRGIEDYLYFSDKEIDVMYK